MEDWREDVDVEHRDHHSRHGEAGGETLERMEIAGDGESSPHHTNETEP